MDKEEPVKMRLEEHGNHILVSYRDEEKTRKNQLGAYCSHPGER